MLTLEELDREYIGAKFKPIEILPMSFLQSDYALGHRRLMVFARKGLLCVHPECNKIGVHVIKAVDAGGNEHIDVYTDKLELMTVDHILPRGAGGSDKLINKQPMCQKHNSKKGDKIPADISIEDLRRLSIHHY